MRLRKIISSFVLVATVVAFGVAEASQGGYGSNQGGGQGGRRHGGCCATDQPRNCQGCCQQKWPNNQQGLQRCLANCQKGNCRR